MDRGEENRPLIPRAVLLAFLGGMPLAAHADCGPEATQSELNTCAGTDYQAADAELNNLYKEMIARLGADKAPLVAAQRAWVTYRDAECDFVASSVAGGSIYPMIRGECLTDLTRARSEEFRGFLACEEGDLSCPVPPG
ncbi:MAG: lysozyme inhibitor LprI family protein [Amaricoccus sp.]|uniref:lysozyme inhibitor LprI family protein n=1 Tax=Amaricoccus sp. TaxID=1872485 RepID=UPI00331620B0